MAQFAIVARKESPQPGVCTLVVSGVPCTTTIASRGVCAYHAQQLRSSGRYEEFALPPIKHVNIRHRIELKPASDLNESTCRVIVNGTPCESPSQRRGLCTTHYAGIWQRDDLNLDDFCAQQQPRQFRRRKVIIEGECRVREAGANCTEPPHARGLCKRHYVWLRTHAPLEFNTIATPDISKRTLVLRHEPKPGRCRVEENGHGCGAIAFHRGLCKHHVNVLRSKPELLETIALPPKAPPSRVYTKKSTFSSIECVVIEDGVPCQEPSSTRGLCQRHRKTIWTAKHYALTDFETQAQRLDLREKTEAESVDGMCRAVINQVLCAHPQVTRGLCRAHYRLADRIGALALFPVTGRTALAALVQVYLDKNVTMDYLDHAAGIADTSEASRRVIEAIHSGRLIGCVSTDGIKSAYNRLRYRLARPGDEGGLGKSEAEAETLSKLALDKLLRNLKQWRIVTLDPVLFLQALRAPGNLSVEDALEWSTYQLARGKPAGPRHFITRDADFVGGVHPAEFMRQLEQR